MRSHMLMVALLLGSTTTLLAQAIGFPYGQVSITDFQYRPMPSDSNAVALILQEFGESHVESGGNFNLMFTHHYRLLVLREDGKKEGTIEIPLYKNKEVGEKMIEIKASSFNVQDGVIRETKASASDFFLEKTDDDMNTQKVVIPNVKTGTILELQYTLETPFFTRNFRRWEFQSHLPKLKSEYWATIPGNYNYNISLKGYLKLTKNENKLVKDCFSVGGGTKADCSQFQLGMDNIPAFKEEEYMTSKRNFISSVNFELTEIRHFNGVIDKVTTDWKVADQELRKDPDFGGQLKRGKDIQQQITPLLTGLTDPLEKARKIYDFIKNWYTWNGYYGKYSHQGIKKAFAARSGNIGDINLSLIAALNDAGISVEPLVLATREIATPTELFPVLSEFNYVVAKVNLGDKVYLLDASDPLLPFGLLPERCLNGKGRVFGDGPSYWHPITPADKERTVTVQNIELTTEGKFTGTIDNVYSGYKAYYQRKLIKKEGGPDGYKDYLKKLLDHAEVSNIEITDLDNLDAPLKIKYTIMIDAFDNTSVKHLILNPYLNGKLEKNPFQLADRQYPVDYGAPYEMMLSMNLKVPTSFELVDIPELVATTLPNRGGRFLYEVKSNENQVILNTVFSITKPLYQPEEYQYLKELYAALIQTQNIDLIFKRKN